MQIRSLFFISHYIIDFKYIHASIKAIHGLIKHSFASSLEHRKCLQDISYWSTAAAD